MEYLKKNQNKNRKNKKLIITSVVFWLMVTLGVFFYENQLLSNSSTSSSKDNSIQILKLESKCDCRKEIFYISEFKKDYENTTCDLYNVIRRGYGQKVVSYSLYGTVPMYYSELKYLSQLVAKHYPTWIIRIHYDKTVNSSVICEFECLKDDKSGNYMNNIDFCNINEIPFGKPFHSWDAQFMHSMKWRFLPIGDPFVDMFMSRDLDSWILDREVSAVNVWFQSNSAFHIMRGNLSYFLTIN